METWQLISQIAEIVATGLAMVAATACAVLSGRVTFLWARFWWTLAALLLLHIGRRAWEIHSGRLPILDSSTIWAGWFAVLALTAAFRARTLAVLIAAEDRLSRLKSMSGLIDSTVADFAKSIEERADKVEQILDEKEEEKPQG